MNTSRPQFRAANPEMSKSEISAQVQRLGPFHHAIELPHGLSTYVPSTSRQDRERTRLQTLLDHAWPSILDAAGGTLAGKRVLDIACNCGGFSVHAAQSGADYVLGIDIDPHYIEQAKFVKQALDLPNLEFLEVDLNELSLHVHGQFDVVLFFGILYHLEDPVATLKRVACITADVIAVDTTLMKIPYISKILDRWPLWHMRRVAETKPDATNITTSRWRPREFCQFSPNGRAVKDLMEYAGFEDVRRLYPHLAGLEQRYYDGRRATFIAKRVRTRAPA